VLRATAVAFSWRCCPRTRRIGLRPRKHSRTPGSLSTLRQTARRRGQRHCHGREVLSGEPLLTCFADLAGLARDDPLGQSGSGRICDTHWQGKIQMRRTSRTWWWPNRRH
ncbi:unnamed protein product, partial [Effrenium voratum]